MTRNRVFTLSRLAVLLLAATTLAAAQTYTDVYNFGSHSGDPNDPQYSGIVAQGRDGNLYSTSDQNWTGGMGDAFKITPAGKVTNLHEFDGTDGQNAVGGLTLADDGNFYGTTLTGGAFNFGTIFKVTTAGKFTTLYSFTNGADSSDPLSPPIQGLDGNLYGTASDCFPLDYGSCPTPGDSNNGSVYKITPTGEITVLHTFLAADGANPFAPLVQTADGNFYGTAVYGGKNGDGTIFKIGPLGKFEVLFNFDDASGASPYGPLTVGGDGNFYGLTINGGASGGGTAFKITPGGKFTVLHNFTGGSDGEGQGGGLLEATDGNFYGINDLGGANGWGVFFRISPAGTFTTLHDFDYGTGASPQNTPVQHTNGIVYGTTAVGGSGGNGNGQGVLYSLDLGLAPFVTFLPSAREVGNRIDILGQGLTGTTAVSFNGTTASFKVNSDTYVSATLPDGAKSGFITVTAPGGVLTSNKKFLVKPQITGFSPASGPVGTSVIITGLSLAQTSEVKIGGVAAKFTVNSDKQVTATVSAGAASGHRVAITTTGAATYSANFFVVTE